MRFIFISTSLLFLYSVICPAQAETDTQTCMWLKEKYKDCLKTRGWRRSEWYDVFGGLLFATPELNDNKTSGETLSLCNSWYTTLKEERCQ